MKFCWESVAVVLVFLQALLLSPCAQAQLKVLVPAYANPNSDPTMWSRLISFGSAQPNRLAVIFNPESGPGPGPVDPNYVGISGQGPLVNLINTGATVLGYVPVGFGTRSPAEVREDIARYYRSSYWRGSTARLDGIFLDEVEPNLALVPYYESIRDEVRAQDPNAILVGNPGRTGVSNPNGQTTYSVSQFVSAFNTLVVYEDSRANFATMYQPPAWIGNSIRSQVAMIVHGATEQELRATFELMVSRGAGWIYITDDVLPNPYDRLPTYWTAETQLVLQPRGRTITGNLSGAWWDPARGGEGFLFDIATVGSRNVFFVTWFTYAQNRQLWLAGNQDLPPNATSVTNLRLYSTSGNGFGSAFNPNQVQLLPFGNASFEFLGCNELKVTYTMDAQAGAPMQTGTLSLRRFVGTLTGVPCT